VMEMLHGYRDGRSTEQIFESVLGADPEAVDAEFDAWLRRRASPENARAWQQLMLQSRELLQQNAYPQARRSLEAAAELFPVARSGSPYALLAQIHLREDDEAAAIDALRRLTRHDETAYQANLELARLLEEA